MRRAILDYLRRVEARGGDGALDRLVQRALGAYRGVRSMFGQRQGPVASRVYLRWRDLERGAAAWRYHFVTLAELVVWTSDWVRSLPGEYDVVVGIPRSGLLVAGIVALKLGKPLTTPDGVREDRYWQSVQMHTGPGGYRRALLIDDSVSSGETFRRNLALVRAAKPEWEVTRAALIVTPEARAVVDLSYVEIPQPRLFEWNMLHVKRGVLAVDMDGVLCENCPPRVDQDEGRYAEWIRTARPYLIPTFEIDVIVSSRLERYRPDTEAWLARHGVRYREIMLWEIDSKREARGRHAQQKIEKLLRLKPEMFWESSGGQAREIWRATRIPTLCVDEMRLFS